MAQMVKRLSATQETGFDPWVGKIPWRRKWQPAPVFLPGKSHGSRSLVATVHGVAKSRTRLSDFPSLHNVAEGLPWWLSSKEPACQYRRCRFNPWVGKVSWRRKWQPAPVFLPGESHGQRSLAGYSSGVAESQTRPSTGSSWAASTTLQSYSLYLFFTTIFLSDSGDIFLSTEMTVTPNIPTDKCMPKVC